MESDIAKLERILEGIAKHAGEITLPAEVLWVQEIQRTQPEWAKPILEKYSLMKHDFPGVR